MYIHVQSHMTIEGDMGERGWEEDIERGEEEGERERKGGKGEP